MDGSSSWRTSPSLVFQGHQLHMEKRRITVVFSSTGNRFVLHDEWDGPVKNPGCLSEGEAWTGWTFFQRRTSSTAPAPVPYAAGAMAGAPSTTSSATASDAQEVVIAADTPQSTMVEVGRQDQLEVPDPPYPDALRLQLPLGYGGNSLAKPKPKERARAFFNSESLSRRGSVVVEVTCYTFWQFSKRFCTLLTCSTECRESPFFTQLLSGSFLCR